METRSRDSIQQDTAMAREQEGGGGAKKVRLVCPFCGGRRFDKGREIYAGPERVLYARLPPAAPGQRPEDQIALKMRGTVCLDCGFVAMMVDTKELRAPVRRRAGQPALDFTVPSGPAVPLESLQDEAADALAHMQETEELPPDLALEQLRRARQKD